MPTILVADDCVVDRCLVEKLLAQRRDLQVTFAPNGATALAAMACNLPDVVIADLMMPELNGLELTATIRREYPQVPVILMTSQGSEEIAVQALLYGAASYVPKRMLVQHLLETVTKVLDLSHAGLSFARLRNCVRRLAVSFRLENDATLFVPLIAYLQDESCRLGVCRVADRTRIGIALSEGLCNALYHGNLEIESELRESDAAAYYALAERRRYEPPFCERAIDVDVQISPDEAVFEIRDGGCGFNPSALPDPTDPANISRPFGRGVLLMRSFMDEVVFNDKGNAVRMVKRAVA